MDQRKRTVEIGEKLIEGSPERLALRHQHVVMIGLRLKAGRQTDGFFQAAANAIAKNGAAEFLGDGKADARAEVVAGCRPPVSLDRESLHARPTPFGRALEIGAAPEAADLATFAIALGEAHTGVRFVHFFPSARPWPLESRARGIRRKDACGREPDAR
jgi:hypothetical protein